MGHAGEPEHGDELNKKIYAQIEPGGTGASRGEHPYVFLDGIVAEADLGRRSRERGSAGGDRRGCRRLSRDSGVCEGTKEDKESWRNFLRHLKERGLRGVRLAISDKCLGLVEALCPRPGAAGGTAVPHRRQADIHRRGRAAGGEVLRGS